jgi:predicted Zn-dependent protease
MTSDLEVLASQVLSTAQKGEAMEVYVTRGSETEVSAYDGEIETLAAATSAGIGVRILQESPEGQRVGFAWAGSLDEEVIAATVLEARDNATFSSPDPDMVLATPDGVAQVEVQLFDESVRTVTTDEKITFALELERKVRAADKVRGVRSSSYGDAEVEMALASTAGILTSTRRSSAGASVEVIAADGDFVQTGYGYDAGRGFSSLNLDKIAADGIQRAVAMLGATKAKRAALIGGDRMQP